MKLLPGDIEEIATGIGSTAAEFAGKRVLMTGACGFLGQYFLALFRHLNNTTLKEHPVKVMALDNGVTSKVALQELRALNDEHLQVTEHDVVKPLHPEDHIDFILSMAGIASPAHYKRLPLQTIDVAVAGLRNMLGIARAHQSRLLFFSSSEIYGDPDTKHIPIPESYRGNVACLGDRCMYDESKRLGETLCWVYHQQYGVQTRIVRPFNVYGPGMPKNDFRVLPNFFTRAVHGESLKVYGTGNQTRTFTYVTDAIIGFTKVLVGGSHGEAYNVGNPKPEISMAEVARLVLASVPGSQSNIDVVEYPDTYPADEPQRRCPDITKIQAHLGFAPRVPLTEGLLRFGRWALEAYA